MFLDKPSPSSLRVKSKKVELLLLRKFNAFKIYQNYIRIFGKDLKEKLI